MPPLIILLSSFCSLFCFLCPRSKNSFLFIQQGFYFKGNLRSIIRETPYLLGRHSVLYTEKYVICNGLCQAVNILPVQRGQNVGVKSAALTQHSVKGHRMQDHQLKAEYSVHCHSDEKKSFNTAKCHHLAAESLLHSFPSQRYVSTYTFQHFKLIKLIKIQFILVIKQYNQVQFIIQISLKSFYLREDFSRFHRVFDSQHSLLLNQHVKQSPELCR